MKRFIAIAALGMIALPTFSQYKIKGNITGYKGNVFLVQPDVSGKNDTLKQVKSSNGMFAFEGKVQQPVMVKVCFSESRLVIPVFLESKSYDITGDTRYYNIAGGGDLQKLYSEFLAKKSMLIKERDSLKAEYIKEYGKDDVFGNLQIKGLQDTYQDKYDEAENEFIRNNDNLVSACLLADRCRELMSKKQLSAKYALLGENAKNTVQGKWLKPYADKIARIVPGGIAPDLKMQTPDGGTLSIYDVKAKVKILDFWASWCGPCRAENPNVKRIYEKNKDKGLEIISISLDNKKDAWVKAISADGLTWKHMSDLKGWKSIVTDVYEIHAVPTLFVLDADNRIIAEGLRGEALEKCVVDALGK